MVLINFFYSRTEITEFISRYVATKEHKENPFVYIDGTSYMHI